MDSFTVKPPKQGSREIANAPSCAESGCHPSGLTTGSKKKRPVQMKAQSLGFEYSSTPSPFQLKQALDRSPRVVTQAKLAATMQSSLVQRRCGFGKKDELTPSLPNGLGGQAILQTKSSIPEETRQLKLTENRTGLPDSLKAGVEAMSGLSMDDVRVHYNSDKPAQLQAHAYTQGSDIHVAPGQDRHLAHEAWHVVQQKQGRVTPTVQMKAGIGVNDDRSLESEADAMAAKLSGGGTISREGRTEANRRPPTGTRQLAVVELAYPRPSAGESPAQLLAIANVVVFNDGGGAKVMAINFAERVPTTVGNGQGDHGVAEVLIQESISSLTGKTVYEYLKGLYERVEKNLEGLEIARHTSQLGKSFGTNKTALLNRIAALAGDLATTPPENLQYLLSELTTEYWRLLEKRDLTAFARSKALTTGGGQEKEGIQGLRRVKERLSSQKGRDYDYGRDDALDDAIGYTPFLMDLIAHEFGNEDLETLVVRAATHVADFLQIDDPAFVKELAEQLGYSFRSLQGPVTDDFFGLVGEDNVSDMRDDSEIREFATWEDARFTRLYAGELIRITNHQYDISDRIFEVTSAYDPSVYEHPPETPPVRWINQ